MTGFVMRRRSHVRAAGFYIYGGSWGDSPVNIPIEGQGALAATAATVVGDGQGDPAYGNGDMSAQAATMAGEGTSQSVGEGALASAASTLTGDGAVT